MYISSTHIYSHRLFSIYLYPSRICTHIALSTYIYILHLYILTTGSFYQYISSTYTYKYRSIYIDLYPLLICTNIRLSLSIRILYLYILIWLFSIYIYTYSLLLTSSSYCTQSSEHIHTFRSIDQCI